MQWTKTWHLKINMLRGTFLKYLLNKEIFTLTVVTSACLDFGPTLVLDAWIVDVLLWDLTKAFVMNTQENANVNLDFLGISVKYVQMDQNHYWMDALTVSVIFSLRILNRKSKMVKYAVHN